MWVDEIVEEIRAIREEHAARFDYDLDTIFEDLKAQEQQSQYEVVTLAPRRQQPDEMRVTPIAVVTSV